MGTWYGLSEGSYGSVRLTTPRKGLLRSDVSDLIHIRRSIQMCGYVPVFPVLDSPFIVVFLFYFMVTGRDLFNSTYLTYYFLNFIEQIPSGCLKLFHVYLLSYFTISVT